MIKIWPKLYDISLIAQHEGQGNLLGCQVIARSMKLALLKAEKRSKYPAMFSSHAVFVMETPWVRAITSLLLPVYQANGKSIIQVRKSDEGKWLKV